jgi:hypothetical protein
LFQNETSRKPGEEEKTNEEGRKKMFDPIAMEWPR